MIAPKFAELLGQKIVIENRPGASGNIGAAYAAKAPPDGYTILAFISSHAINPSLMKQVPYDLARDFIPISRTVTVPGVIVSNAAVPARTCAELIALAKSRPGQLSFGSGRHRQHVASDDGAVPGTRRREARACALSRHGARRSTTSSAIT